MNDSVNSEIVLGEVIHEIDQVVPATLGLGSSCCSCSCSAAVHVIPESNA